MCSFIEAPLNGALGSISNRQKAFVSGDKTIDAEDKHQKSLFYTRHAKFYLEITFRMRCERKDTYNRLFLTNIFTNISQINCIVFIFLILF